jgi:hypothetical protein
VFRSCAVVDSAMIVEDRLSAAGSSTAPRDAVKSWKFSGSI